MASEELGMPDLSHLTEDERRIIESVMHRHREEEDKESELLRWVQLWVNDTYDVKAMVISRPQIPGLPNF